MQRILLGLLGLALLLASLALYRFFQSDDGTGPPAALAPAAPETEPAPEIRHPVPGVESVAVDQPELAEQAEPPPPLPAVDQSDAAVEGELATLLGDAPLSELFNLENFIRRLVVTIDNLPRRQIPQRYLPTSPVAGKFKAAGEEQARALNPENFARYDRHVQLLELIDLEQLVEVYFRFYPLFQEAYEDLGYPRAYFNDRLVEVIDDLLATPRVEGPIGLVQPSVMFKYADPELERRSAGQKTLIRMGPANAERIKTRLRELRALITAAPRAAEAGR